MTLTVWIVQQSRDIYRDSFPSSSTSQLYKRELFSSRDNIYATTSNRGQQHSSIAKKDSGQDSHSSGGGKDVYGTGDKDKYSRGGRDIYSGSTRDVYSNRTKDVYSSGGRDIYASPHHRIVYTTESPIGISTNLNYKIKNLTAE